MKKQGLRMIAWVVLMTMLVSFSGMTGRAHAAEIPEDELFLVTMEELTNGDVLLLSGEGADKSGTMVATGGTWKKVIIRRAEELKTVYLAGIKADTLVIEGGMACNIRLNECNIGTLYVTAPQTGGISFAKLYEKRDAGEDISGLISRVFRYYQVMMATQKLHPNVITDDKTSILQMNVLTNTKLDLTKGMIGEVHIETKDVYGSMNVELKGYDGAVSVEQNRDEREGSSSLGLKMKNCEIASLKVTGESGACHVDGDTSTIGEMAVSGAYSVVTSVDTTSIVLDETAKKASVRIYSEVENVEVKGDENKVILSATANVGKAVVEGDSTKIYGYGKLESAEISGEKANVAVHGTKVSGENDATIPDEMVDMIARPATPKPSAIPKPTQSAAPTATVTPVPTATPTPVPDPVTYDFRDGSIVPTTTDGKADVVFGNLTIRKSATSAYQYNGKQHGVAFKDGNVIEIKVVGPTKIQLGDCSYSGMSEITLTNADGSWSQTQPAAKACGGVVEFTYNGPATTLKIALNAQVYVPYLKVIPIEGSGDGEPIPTPTPGPVTYDFEDGSIVPKDTDGKSDIVYGDLTIKVGTQNAYQYNGDRHGTAFKAGNSIEIKVNGPVKVEVGDCAYSDMTSLTMTNADGSWTQTKTVKNGCYHNGKSVVFEYNGEATTLILGFTAKCYIPCIIVTPVKVTNTPTPTVTNTPTPTPTNTPTPTPTPVVKNYNFKDASSIPSDLDGSQVYEQDTLKLNPTYSYNGGHGYAFSNGSSIEISVDGPTQIEIGNCQYSGMATYTLTSKDYIWSQSADKAAACGDALTFTYPGEATTLVLTVTSTIYVPYITTTELFDEPRKLQKETTYDFRDGSIIPTDTNGKSDVTFGDLTVKVGPSNAYAYNGAQHGVQFKSGNSIEIKVEGSVAIRVGDCQFSAYPSMRWRNEDDTWGDKSEAGTGCDNVLKFTYFGGETTLILEFTDSTYVPWIKVTTLVSE